MKIASSVKLLLELSFPPLDTEQKSSYTPLTSERSSFQRTTRCQTGSEQYTVRSLVPLFITRMDYSSRFRDEVFNDAISALLRPQPIPKAILVASRIPLVSDFISQPTSQASGFLSTVPRSNPRTQKFGLDGSKAVRPFPLQRNVRSESGAASFEATPFFYDNRVNNQFLKNGSSISYVSVLMRYPAFSIRDAVV